jgi:hypothetical protein
MGIVESVRAGCDETDRTGGDAEMGSGCPVKKGDAAVEVLYSACCPCSLTLNTWIANNVERVYQ